MTATKERTVAFREKTWAEKAQEILPRLIDDISIPQIIDEGISVYGPNFACLIEDKKDREERNQYKRKR